MLQNTSRPSDFMVCALGHPITWGLSEIVHVSCLAHCLAHPTGLVKCDLYYKWGWKLYHWHSETVLGRDRDGSYEHDGHLVVVLPSRLWGDVGTEKRKDASGQSGPLDSPVYLCMYICICLLHLLHIFMCMWETMLS